MPAWRSGSALGLGDALREVLGSIPSVGTLQIVIIIIYFPRRDSYLNPGQKSGYFDSYWRLGNFILILIPTYTRNAGRPVLTLVVFTKSHS